jgi:hypothetical protein
MMNLFMQVCMKDCGVAALSAFLITTSMRSMPRLFAGALPAVGLGHFTKLVPSMEQTCLLFLI